MHAVTSALSPNLTNETNAALMGKMEECQKKVKIYEERISTSKSEDHHRRYSILIQEYNAKLSSYQTELNNRQQVAGRITSQQNQPQAKQNNLETTAAQGNEKKATEQIINAISIQTQAYTLDQQQMAPPASPTSSSAATAHEPPQTTKMTKAALRVKIEECQRRIDGYRTPVSTSMSEEHKARDSTLIQAQNAKLSSYQMELKDQLQLVDRIILQQNPPEANQSDLKPTVSSDNKTTVTDQIINTPSKQTQAHSLDQLPTAHPAMTTSSSATAAHEPPQTTEMANNVDQTTSTTSNQTVYLRDGTSADKSKVEYIYNHIKNNFIGRNRFPYLKKLLMAIDKNVPVMSLTWSPILGTSICHVEEPKKFIELGFCDQNGYIKSEFKPIILNSIVSMHGDTFWDTLRAVNPCRLPPIQYGSETVKLRDGSIANKSLADNVFHHLKESNHDMFYLLLHVALEPNPRPIDVHDYGPLIKYLDKAPLTRNPKVLYPYDLEHLENIGFIDKAKFLKPEVKTIILNAIDRDVTVFHGLGIVNPY